MSTAEKDTTASPSPAPEKPPTTNSDTPHSLVQAAKERKENMEQAYWEWMFPDHKY